MSQLQYYERPDLRDTVMLAAWAGWSDAAEAATRGMKEIVRQLEARKFASIDAEDYFDFTQQRPVVGTGPDGSRTLTWPENDFYYRKGQTGGEWDLVIFIGSEPHLKWRSYAGHVLEVVKSTRVRLLVTVGALLDSVPHTRSPRIAGSSISDNLGPGFERISYPRPAYEGPAGMTSVISDAVTRLGIPTASVWGHAPHYVQVAHNPAISHGILKEIQPFLPRALDLAPLDRESQEFGENLLRALEDQKEIEGYVRRLEERYDSEEESRRSPEPAQLVQELEDFLREQRRRNEDDEGDIPN